MLSCFHFSYSPLKDDDYTQLFIGQQQYQLAEEANDNSLNISLSVDTSAGDNRLIAEEANSSPRVASEQTADSHNRDRHSPLVPNANRTPPRSSPVSTPSDQSPGFETPVNQSVDHKLSLPRTFRKPDSIIAPACDSVETTASTLPTNKSGRLKFCFNRSKGTEHLQEALTRKSNDSSLAHAHRYIKLPTSSVARFIDHDKNNIKLNVLAVSQKSAVSPDKCSRPSLTDPCPPPKEAAPQIPDSPSPARPSTAHPSLARSSLTRSSSKPSPSSSRPQRPSPSPPSSSSVVSPNQIPKQPLTKSLGLNPAPSCIRNSQNSPSPKPPPRPLTSHPGTGSKIMPRQKVQWASASSNAASGYNSVVDGAADNHVSSSTTGDTSLVGASSAASNRNGNSTADASTSSTSATPEWTKSAGFINKPPRGWLHPDQKIAESGMSYAVRYIGCLGINTSMKSLDFETRSQIAKECINRVCEAGGLKTVDKKRRPEKRISRMLADNPNMESAGSNVTLTITSSYLNLTVMETGEVIAKHEMPNISFASGGDAETLDFVSFVAKDHRYGRACFVLECGGGLAQDVITTIGQAFELRFKEFLKRTPRTGCNERIENNHQNGSNHSPRTGVLEEREYYNDLPGKIPPDVDVPSSETQDSSATSTKEVSAMQRVLPQAAPRSCFKKTSSEQNSPNLIDLNTDIQGPLLNEEVKDAGIDPGSQHVKTEPQYVNCTDDENANSNDTVLNINSSTCLKDPFDMQPFNSAIANVATSHDKSSLHQEEWYHGPISRKDSEMLVVRDGDFLVRESQGSTGQYVLTGMQSGTRKHLLLVDPEGVVRTKDKTFESVSHLINYHRNNGLPIISAESAIVLRTPVVAKR